MNPEVEARFQRIEALLLNLAESQTAFRQDLANTQAIANSNARSIEAMGNQQVVIQREIAQFVRSVAEYSQATELRLTALKNRQ